MINFINTMSDNINYFILTHVMHRNDPEFLVQIIPRRMVEVYSASKWERLIISEYKRFKGANSSICRVGYACFYLNDTKLSVQL
jgi:hypothetical protein